MPHQRMQILPLTKYTFTGLGASTSMFVTLARLDVSRWQEIVVTFRVHEVGWNGSGQELAISWRDAGNTPEDPGAKWQSGGVNTLITVLSGTVAPYFAVASIPYPRGPVIEIFLRGTQGTSGGFTLAPFVSCDLTCRQ
jgi:hypothetical protein